jgi:NinB protein
MQYKLTSPDQASGLMKMLWPKIKEALHAGKELSLSVEDAGRSDEQNKKYHAIINQISKAAKHQGAHWDAEVWKRLLVDQFATEMGLGGSQIIASIDNTRIVQLGLQTRKFTKDQGSQFIEWLTAWCADKEIDLDQV